MTAIRSVRAAEGKFVQIANGALQDRRLTAAARGVLAFVLSLPPDKHFTAEWLVTQMPDGERAIRSALRNLEQYGYFRRTRTSCGGTWTWDQVISDEAAENPIPMKFPQVSASGKKSRDAATSGSIMSSLVSASANHARDAKRRDKELNTETTNTEDHVNTMASRRAHSSGASANWTVDRVVRDVREAVAQVHGQQEADGLTDGEALGLFYTYVKDRRPRDLVAYVVSIIGCAPYLDTFMSNVEAACTRCVQWESNCACPAAA